MRIQSILVLCLTALCSSVGMALAQENCTGAAGVSASFQPGAPSSAVDAARQKLITEELQDHIGPLVSSAGVVCEIRFEPAPNLKSDQGYRIWRDGGSIVVSASNSLGHLYGTYDLLKQLGFRWNSPTDTIRPEGIDWDLVSAESVEQPRFRLRGFWTFRQSPSIEFLRYMARNQFNLIGQGNPDDGSEFKTLGIHQWGGGHDVISLLAGSDVEFEGQKLGLSHPEWYAPRQGEAEPLRAGADSYANPCFTNNLFVDFFSERLAEELATGSYRAVDVLNLWPSDAVSISMPKHCPTQDGVASDTDALMYFYRRLVSNLAALDSRFPRNREVTLAGIGYNDTIDLGPGLPNETGNIGFVYLGYPIARSYRSSFGSELDSRLNRKIWSLFASTRSQNPDVPFGMVEYFNQSTDMGMFHGGIGTIDAELAALERIKATEVFAYMHTMGGTNEMENMFLRGLGPALFASKTVEPGIQAYVSDSAVAFSEVWHAIENYEEALSNRTELFGSGSSLQLMLRTDLIWPSLRDRMPAMLSDAYKMLRSIPFEMPALRLGTIAPADFDGFGPLKSIALLETCEVSLRNAISVANGRAGATSRVERLLLECERARLLYKQLALLYDVRTSIETDTADAARIAYRTNLDRLEHVDWPSTLNGSSPREQFRATLGDNRLLTPVDVAE